MKRKVREKVVAKLLRVSEHFLTEARSGHLLGWGGLIT
jgi:hypothetical protein